MKQIIGVLLILFSLVTMVICAVHMTIFRFQNPDMTSIRCVLENTSLIPWEIGAILGHFIGGVMVKE